MSTAAVRGVVRQLGLADSPADPPSDSTLLTRYARLSDHAAFAELLRRHGPVVLGVCRRVLADPHAAEDAFQATFLVLARKADTVRPAGSVGGWLYGVAVRTARKAKVAAARRWRREMSAARQSASPDREVGGSLEQADLRAVIDEELGRLPDALRNALVLCDLDGKSRSEAAAELGWPEGTVAARLHKARKLLAGRLTRRGVALPAAGLAALLVPEAVSADLARSTLSAAEAFATGAAQALVPPAVRSLAEGVMRTMTAGKFKLVIGIALAAGLLAGGGILWGASGKPRDAAEPPSAPKNEVKVRPSDLTEPDRGKAAAPGEWQEHKSLTDHDDLVDGVAFSPDGKTFVTGGGGTVILWDAATLRILWKSQLKNPGVSAVAFHPDGKRVAATRKDGVTLLDAATGKTVQEIEEPGSNPSAVAFGEPKAIPEHHVNRLAFTDGRKLVAKSWIDGAEPGTASLGPLAGIAKLGHYPAAVAYSPDGEQLVFIPNTKMDPDPAGKGTADPKKATHYFAQVWGAGSGKPMQLLPHGTDPVTAVAWSKDGRWIATGDATGDVVLWDAAEAKQVRRMHIGGRGGKSVIRALVFTPDGKTLAAAAEFDEGKNANRVIMLDLASGKDAQHLQFFWKSPVVSFAFAPDGRTLVAACGHLESVYREMPPDKRKEAGEIQVWTVGPADRKPDPKPVPGDAPQEWKERNTIPDLAPVHSVAFAPDGKTFAIAGAGNDVQLRDLATLKVLTTIRIKEAERAVYGLSYRHDGKVLAITNTNSFGLYDPLTGGTADTPGQRSWAGQFTAIAYSPDGKQVALSDGFATVIQSLSGDGGRVTVNGPRELQGGRGKLPAGLAWAPDGKTVAYIHPVAAGKSVISFAEFGPGTGANALEAHAGKVTAVAWSKDGKVLVTGGADGSVSLWDVTISQEIHRLPVTIKEGTAGRVFSVAISPDGKTVAAGTETWWLDQKESVPPSQVVIVWDVASSRQVARFEHTGEQFVSLAFSPDARTLIGGRGRVAWEEKPVGGRKDAGEVKVWTIAADR